MAQMKEIQIEGMSCGHCVRAATEALLGIPGVEAATVDLESGIAQLSTSGTIDLESVATALDEEGFKLVAQ